MKRWIKMWINECLEGTIRFDFEPDERCVWYELLLLAGRCRQEGVIAAGPGRPYPRRWIAGVLNIPEELLDRTLVKCIATVRASDNNDGITILNWAKYQPEYDRQKPYREAKRRAMEEDPEYYSKGKYGVCPKCHQRPCGCKEE